MKRIALFSALLLSLAACGRSSSFNPESTAFKKADAPKALTMLKEGNARFATGKSVRPGVNLKRIALAARSNQADYAHTTVLCCSDSRVSPELLFDAGLMELFVVRVAGNIADTDEIGSVEYGVLHAKTPLLLVLGHTQCGAVHAETQAICGHETGQHEVETNIAPLIEHVEESVEESYETLHSDDMDAVETLAVSLNVRHSIADILRRSPEMRKAVLEKKVTVVGAVYNLSVGRVEWLPSFNMEEWIKTLEADPKCVKSVVKPDENHAKTPADKK